jgi:hypothetical protein
LPFVFYGCLVFLWLFGIFMAIWYLYILWQFYVFCRHLIHTYVHYFSFRYVVPWKIWQPRFKSGQVCRWETGRCSDFGHFGRVQLRSRGPEQLDERSGGEVAVVLLGGEVAVDALASVSRISLDRKVFG